MIELKTARDGRRHISPTVSVIPITILIGLLCWHDLWAPAMLLFGLCSLLVIWGMGTTLCKFATVTTLRMGYSRRNNVTRTKGGRRKEDTTIIPHSTTKRISSVHSTKPVQQKVSKTPQIDIHV